MQPDTVFWLVLPAKMAVTAAFVVVAARAAEFAGPLIGAMVATLPISAGPAYVFLALDHGPAFIAASAVSSLAANAANVVFCVVHAAVAQSRSWAASLVAALGAWALFAIGIGAVRWTLSAALLFNLIVFAVSLPIASRFRRVAMPPVHRRWYDLPVRAGLVAVLVAIVVVLSAHVGPKVTGILALFPIVLSSLVLIFQPRIGGPATAALTANSVAGLTGYAAVLVVVHLGAVPLGPAAALLLALCVSVGWNLSIVIIRRRDPSPAWAKGRNRTPS